ncbi:MAG TPA: antirestriction protein ArdA [Acidimicrobiales bacterium]|jgi:antirestriction protein
MEERPENREGAPSNASSNSSSEMRKQQSVSPRIYAASLNDYNEGILHGKWIDVACPCENIEAQIQDMLDSSPTSGAEEFGIFDFDGFGPWRPGEYESISVLARVAHGIVQHGAAFAHWAALAGTADSELDRFEAVYVGHYRSFVEYAERILEEYELPEQLENAVPSFLNRYVHLDITGFANDLLLDGDVDVSEGDGGVYVFDGAV